MSHLDDGRLHAYLDGELAAGEEAPLLAHTAACAECRARLDLARATRTRAHEILRLADPPAVVAPDFATLVARRRIVEPARGSAPRYRPLLLPWAATVVLALGAGWFAQELIRGSGGGADRVATLADDSRPASASAESGEMRSLASGVEQEQVEGDLAAPAASRDEAVAMQAPAGPAGGASDAADGVGTPAPDARQEAAAPLRSEEVVAGEGATRNQADANVALRTRTGATPPPAVRPSAAGAEAAVGAAAGDRAAAPVSAAAPPPPPAPAQVDSEGWPLQWTSVDRAAAVRALGTEPVLVAGLLVEGYQLGDAAGAPVRVLQQLPGGETLEVLQRRWASPLSAQAAREAAAPAAEAEPGAGRAGFSLLRGNLDIRVRAPLPPDSLSRLMERVQ